MPSSSGYSCLMVWITSVLEDLSYSHMAQIIVFDFFDIAWRQIFKTWSENENMRILKW